LKELNSILSTITKFSGRGNTKLHGTGRFIGGNTLQQDKKRIKPIIGMQVVDPVFELFSQYGY
tara:strand:+ start:285 stop:473 length:189 start_codon:yes stop_codon:yes gene_type:complete